MLPELIRVTGYAVAVVVLFFGLSASGLLSSLTIDSKSSSGAFFLFGLIRSLPTGFMTILLPCGFTMAAEGAAILSGNPWQGMTIMTFFVMGTMLPLLVIVMSGSELSNKPSTSRVFMKTAGLLVIFFTLYNLNSQFGLAAKVAGRNEPPAQLKTAATTGSARIIRTASSNSYFSTNRFDVKKGEKNRTRSPAPWVCPGGGSSTSSNYSGVPAMQKIGLSAYAARMARTMVRDQ
ncbi:MAG TPA: sulfite exporter TauE/SafE family protein [Chlorobaculum sp.]|jgi:hypothetical protein|uniref:Urease accessory protein UreH-like transmembrane domain-containing protein n=1 Tax=Chlorobaculum tepidum (strain ATCC 49652 / DSM 12025 / NBRC 103806 / TLS) TaxID=194439 RepID=Q8KE74_CHLTE|nr:sulfite exporter TauE/SafE family protein [Chlorobaculum tepidum]AAM72052.1 hypothetical protein CT0816 [Chlorobaculum tepidum TLS]HBU22970.1 sulfite exporter TauE/SafE family protein [Chlorobaculum sp.]